VLNEGRVDVVIATRLTGLHVLSKFQYQGVKELGPPLVTIGLYHYLHNKHEALLQKISASLSEMQKNGTILKKQERFYKKFIIAED
jgi:polar amino acid transport system substrate-binding protein